MNLTALRMKPFAPFSVLLLALAAFGCSGMHRETANLTPAAIASAPIITPDFSLAAKVVSVNTIGRFVVLNFPASQLPQIGQTLFLYRGGLKVAEVNVTGPQQDNDTVADIASGDAQVGDNVRDE